MSHKTEIKTELTNLDYMKKALDKLGFNYETGEGLKANIMDGSKVDVELLITGNGKQKFSHNIGFQKQADGTYNATGDFWGLKNAEGKTLTKQFLKQEVTASSKEAELIDRLNALGFEKCQGTENSDKIEITLERWT